MKITSIKDTDRQQYNTVITHPLQSYGWGEFRKKTGTKVIRRGFLKKEKLADGFQITIHHIPHTPWNIGYVPKCNLPTKDMLEELKKIGKNEHCLFIQLEPNVRVSNFEFRISSLGLVLSAHPLFTKYTFVLNLTQSEEDILKDFHSKTRYNIRVAEKHGVTVIEDNSDEAFGEYLKLTKETTRRQGFYAHSENYHRLMWETLKVQSSKLKVKSLHNELSAHLLVARYKGETLTAWILFVFKDTLYYPYGASSSAHRETMASNLMMWKAIKFGKKQGLKKFDMWGALGPNPDPKDPWYGFHRFKQGYNPELFEFVGSYDLIINNMLYPFYKIADKLRWLYLRLFK